MELNQLCEIIGRWATSEPLVVRVHIFGSRVKGTFRCDSDLDVALELRGKPGDESLLATWLGEAARFRAELAPRLPVVLQLEWYGGLEETPRVHAGLSAGSRLVYERQIDGKPVQP